MFESERRYLHLLSAIQGKADSIRLERRIEAAWLQEVE